MVYIFAAGSMGHIFVVGSERRIFSATERVPAVQGHPRSTTLGDLERPIRTLLQKRCVFRSPTQTRKPSCRKETARCRSWSFRFKVRRRHSLHFYKFNSSQASNARLQSSKQYTGTKQNLPQNGDSRSFKVMCFGVSGKAIRD